VVEFSRGLRYGEQDQEATRIAEARRGRGHATDAADAQPQLPCAGSAMPPSSTSAAAASTASVDYDGAAGNVPEKAVINITVAARAV
jgi:hypothetical protein